MKWRTWKMGLLLCIISVQEGGGLIQEGADNIDLNTKTIDGKDAFHSMAHAVFQTY
jgi:hypothetical protein